jgi:hypothetical protein
MSLATKPLEQITPADIAALTGSAPDPLRIAVLGGWSASEAAIAAASLANSRGGFIVVGAAVDASGRVTALPGGSIPEGGLAAVAANLGPDGHHLLRSKFFDVDGKSVGLVAVEESAAPPLLAGDDGAIFRRAASGAVRVRTRADLDQLLAKDRVLRERAEHAIDGMVGRVAYGHFAFMTIALVAIPRLSTPEPYHWATANRQALVGGSLGFARRWGLSDSHIHIGAGEIEIARPEEITGFVRIARNGCVAVAQRLQRPPQERFVSPAEFSQQLAEIGEVAAMIYRATRPGVVVPSLLLESVRDLRLPIDGEGGLTAPVGTDLQHVFLPERFIDSADEAAALVRDLQVAAGEAFAADLVRGTAEPYSGPIKSVGPTTKTWHGNTKRTERRLSGARGYGSAR